jgi:ornithine decarboxylase
MVYNWMEKGPSAAPQYITEYLQTTTRREESILFMNLTELERLYHTWQSQFPNIVPFYAVKCNPNPMCIERLAALGVNFDCASLHEINTVLSYDVDPVRIIYANPCKRERDIAEAYSKGITLTTFDTVCELEKIARSCPNMHCVLRIYAKDPDARCQFAHKFGCPPEEWENILQTAQRLQLNIVGISFHVGSGASSGKAYYNAIQSARSFYDLAATYGYHLKLLDLGGGFVSTDLKDIPQQIQNALQTFFPDTTQCSFIAEPGRFFMETIGTLATPVIGVRKTATTRDYWITDSLYGSFNCIFYDHYTPSPTTHKTTQKYQTTFYGPTCDGLDKIIELPFPELELEDWVIWNNMGAYTLSGACNFNGIPFLNTYHVYM